MFSGQCILVETLGRAETWSVVSVNGVPKNFSSLRRAVRPIVLPTVTAAYQTRSVVQRRLPPSRSRWSDAPVRAIPHAGPDGEIHSVLLHIGDAEPNPHPDSLGSVMFRSDQRSIRIDDACYRVVGLEPRPDRESWTVPEAFRYVQRFDDALELVSKTIRCAPGDRWQGTLTVAAPNGPRTVQVAVSNGDETGDPQLWRGIVVDVTAAVPPGPPSFEAIALAALRAGAEGYLAIADLTGKRMIRWITEPMPGVRWQGIVDDERAYHPDDEDRLNASAELVRSGRAETASVRGVRLRRSDSDGWLVVDIHGRRLPLSDDPVFVLLEYRPVDGMAR